MKIGIIGFGFVGKATYNLENSYNKFFIYDINKNLCKPKGLNIYDLVKCKIIFICVPTPMNKDGKLLFKYC